MIALSLFGLFAKVETVIVCMILATNLSCAVMKKEKKNYTIIVKKMALTFKKNSNQLRLVFLFDKLGWGDNIITPEIKNRQSFYPGDFCVYLF
jgi:hypothetical protein